MRTNEGRRSKNIKPLIVPRVPELWVSLTHPFPCHVVEDSGRVALGESEQTTYDETIIAPKGQTFMNCSSKLLCFLLVALSLQLLCVGSGVVGIEFVA